MKNMGLRQGTAIRVFQIPAIFFSSAQHISTVAQTVESQLVNDLEIQPFSAKTISRRIRSHGQARQRGLPKG